MFCRRLERAGHITMVKNDKDARFINVVLTEKGRALVQGMMEQMGSHSEKDSMSKEALETILKGLKCLEKYLQSRKRSVWNFYACWSVWRPEWEPLGASHLSVGYHQQGNRG